MLSPASSATATTASAATTAAPAVRLAITRDTPRSSRIHGRVTTVLALKRAIVASGGEDRANISRAGTDPQQAGPTAPARPDRPAPARRPVARRRRHVRGHARLRPARLRQGDRGRRVAHRASSGGGVGDARHARRGPGAPVELHHHGRRAGARRRRRRRETAARCSRQSRGAGDRGAGRRARRRRPPADHRPRRPRPDRRLAQPGDGHPRGPGAAQQRPPGPDRPRRPGAAAAALARKRRARRAAGARARVHL